LHEQREEKRRMLFEMSHNRDAMWLGEGCLDCPLNISRVGLAL
jgi:hypothetical protein